MKPALLSAAAATLPLLAAAYPQAAPSDPTALPQCMSTLSCSLAAFAGTSMTERLAIVRDLQSQHFGPISAADRFRCVEGIVNFFINNDLGPPESWLSYVDAGILIGIQAGGKLALGLEGAEEQAAGIPGAPEWGKYLVGMRDGTLGDRSAHNFAWATAEQASVDYAVALSDDKFGRTRREHNWFLFSQSWRVMMRNRDLAVKTFARVPVIGLRALELVDWMTNVQDDRASECLSEIAYFFAGQLDGDLSNNDEILTIGPKLFKCLTDAKGQ